MAQITDKIKKAKELKLEIEELEKPYDEELAELRTRTSEVKKSMAADTQALYEELAEIEDYLLNAKQPLTDGAYIRTTPDVKIVDTRVIPQRFFEPSKKLIKDFLKESAYTDDVPGVEKVFKRTVVIRKD